jgi:hypothetical protein
MKKLDGLNLVFISFYVRALTPRLNSTEMSLQLSENITFFAVCRIRRCHQQKTYIDTRCLRLYSVMDRTESCGTLAYISPGIDWLNRTQSIESYSLGADPQRTPPASSLTVVRRPHAHMPLALHSNGYTHHFLTPPLLPRVGIA